MNAQPPEYESVRRLRVFVASPSDVRAERECLPSIIDRLNRGVGRSDSLHLDLWRWEMDAPPGLGEPQTLINPEVDQADIVIVILWKRFGSATARFGSGTEEEVVRAIERWHLTQRPRVQIYACTRPIPLEDLQSDLEIDQLRSVQRLRRALNQIAVVATFSTTDEFATKVHDNLQKAAREIVMHLETPLENSLKATVAKSLNAASHTIIQQRNLADDEEQIEASMHYRDRAKAHRFGDLIRLKLRNRNYGNEAEDSFGTAFLELLTNAITHGSVGAPSGEKSLRIQCTVNETYVSTTVHNPNRQKIDLSALLDAAKKTLETTPFAPNGRGLLLVSEIADEFSCDGLGEIKFVLYRDRVQLVMTTHADITILNVEAGQKNPSLARRINTAICAVSPRKLILNLGASGQLASLDDGGKSEKRLIYISDTVYESCRLHSGNTTAIGPCLPYFAERQLLWRIVCPNDALRALLPKKITHPTMHEALVALSKGPHNAIFKRKNRKSPRV